MHVISLVKIKEFCKNHSQAESPLKAWYTIIRKTNHGTTGKPVLTNNSKIIAINFTEYLINYKTVRYSKGFNS